MNAAVEALWEHLVVERSVLTPGDLTRLRTARAQAQAQGGQLSLEHQLLSVLGRRLEPLREELRQRARSCRRCQRCYLAAPPHGACPGCGQPGHPLQAVESSGVLAPLPSPQASGAFTLTPPSGGFPAPGSGGFPVPPQASGAHPAMSYTPQGSGRFPTQGLLNSQTSRFRSTSSNSRPSGPGGGDGAGLAPGDRVGHYTVVGELGKGGMGAVYKVQSDQGDLRALKVLHSLSGTKQQRFRTEVEVMAKLCHPNLVRVYDCGRLGEYPYYVMDHVEGSDLKELIKQRSLAPRTAVRLLVQVLRAVGYAHTCGVLHRDLKPGNVIVDRELAKTYVLDFGLAKVVDAEGDLTRSGTALGTPYYMPPELAAGRHKEVDGRADVYSLGVMLYELLVGTPPFTAATANELMQKVAKERPPSLRAQGFPAALDKIVQRALAKRPADRFPSAEVMAAELEAWLEARPEGAPLGLKLASLAMTAVVIVLGAVLWLRSGSSPEPARAAQVDPEPSAPAVAPSDPEPEPPPPEPEVTTPPEPTPPEPTPPEPELPTAPAPQPAVERPRPPARVGLLDDPLKPLPKRIATSHFKSPIETSTFAHLNLPEGSLGLTLTLQVPQGATALWARVRGAQEDLDLYLRQGEPQLTDPLQADRVARGPGRDEDLVWRVDDPELPLRPGTYALTVHRAHPSGPLQRASLGIFYLTSTQAPRPLGDVRNVVPRVGRASDGFKASVERARADPGGAARALMALDGYGELPPPLAALPALWALDARDFASAREAAEAVLARDPQEVVSRYVLAACDYADARYEEALARIKALNEEHPRLYQPLELHVRCLLAAGHPQEAAKLGAAAYRYDNSRYALTGLAALGIEELGDAKGAEAVQKLLANQNLDLQSLRAIYEELLRRGRAEEVLAQIAEPGPKWKREEQPELITLLEAEALAAAGREADAQALLAGFEPHHGDLRAQAAALRARLEGAK
ncbi:MAG: protein kinase [Planctomycetota bacterium]